MISEKETIAALIDEVRQKRELRGLSEQLVLDMLKSKLDRKGLEISGLSKLSDRDRKIIIKEVRAELRLLHGRFQSSTKNKEKTLKKEGKAALLNTHLSTKERIPDYEKIKSLISDLKVKSILDLGCGLNPIALGSPELTYYASDINNEELSLIENYFKEKNINGKVFFHDLTKSEMSDLPEADICLVFKVLDILKDRKKIAYNILENVKCRLFLVSFPTKKLSGKRMNNPKRFWFESIVNKLGFSVKSFETSNEIFYLISRDK